MDAPVIDELSERNNSNGVVMMTRALRNRIMNMLGVTAILFLLQICSAQALPLKCYENQRDYSFMW